MANEDSGQSFGELLKHYRLLSPVEPGDPKHTQHWLAVQLGYSPNYISMLERGERQPPRQWAQRIAFVKSIADVLHLTPEQSAALVAAPLGLPAATPPDSAGAAPSQADPVFLETERPAPSVPAPTLLGRAQGAGAAPPLQMRLRAFRFPPVVTLPTRRAGATLAVLLVLLLTAMGSDAYLLLPDPTVAPDDQQVLNVAVLGGQTTQLDPAYVSDSATLSIIRLVFPTLVTFDDHLALVGWAAPLPDVSAQGRTYTFHLRPAMQFSDGEPLDAQAFAYSFNRLLDPCTHSPLAGYLEVLLDAVRFHHEVCTPSRAHALAAGQAGPVLESLVGRSIEVRDAQTLVLHLEHPAVYLLGELSVPAAAAVPADLVQRYGASWTDHLTDTFGTVHGQQVHGLGGNLFKVRARNTLKTVLTLERNESFWGSKPALRTVIVTHLGIAQTLNSGYLYDQTEVTYPTAEQAAQDRRNPALAVQSTNTLGVHLYYLNWRLPPFDDVRMRQAFALALDKTALAKLESGVAGAVPTNHLVPAGMPGYNRALRSPDGRPDAEALSANPTRALALATAYAQDHCGGQLSRCPPVVLFYPSHTLVLPEEQAALRMWQQALPGYPLSMVELAGTAYIDRRTGHTLQVFPLDVGPDYPDPQNLLSLGFLPEAPYNLGDVDAPAATTLLRNADLATDPQQRLRDYQQAEQLLVTQVASIPIAQELDVYEVPSYVRNYRETALGVPSLAAWSRVVIAPHAPLARLSPTASRGPAASLTEFPLPTGSSGPWAIAPGPDNALWFTESAANQVGRITPEGVITEYPLPEAGDLGQGIVNNITAGPDGNLWFVEAGANRIGRITPKGVIAQFLIPTPKSRLDGIVAGPDDALWFTEYDAATIGRITVTGAVTEFRLPPGSTVPARITRGPDGNLWFTEQGSPVIGRITPRGAITEFPVQDAITLVDITLGPDGNLWFTDLAGKIGRMSPSGTLLNLFPVPAGSWPTGIVVGKDGNLWFTAQYASKIGRITPTGRVTLFPLPGPNEIPYGIAAGPDGNIWFTEINNDAIGHISP